MFNATTIKSCLSGLVGFQQHYNKDADRYDSDIASALSGTYINQSSHPLITVENIAAIASGYFKADTSDWSATITYQVGDIVLSDNKIYQSLIANNLNQAVDLTTKWRETSLMSAYLRRLLEGASVNLFNSVFAYKKLHEAAKAILADTSLYDGVGSLTNKVTKSGRFVGYKITPKHPDTVVVISSVGMQFDTPNPAFPLYVYHSSSNEPVYEISIANAKTITFYWKELEAKINLAFNSNTINDNGTYYIGYYEDDLVGQAIWKEEGFNGVACNSCNSVSNHLHAQWSKYVSIQPMYIQSAFLNEEKTMFDISKAIDLSHQNWGLNFKIQVQCDVSDLICRNKFAFIDAMQKQVVHDLLSEMAYSTRDNQVKEKVRQMAMLALNGDKEDYAKGIKTELKEAIEGVSFDISDMSSVCLPCNKRAGMRVSSMY